jgi:hypothetical protein
MRFVEYTAREAIEGDEIIFISRTTGAVNARLPLATTKKSQIMDLYDLNRIFIAGNEYGFNGPNLQIMVPFQGSEQ